VPSWQARRVQQSASVAQALPLSAQTQLPPWQVPPQQSPSALQSPPAKRHDWQVPARQPKPRQHWLSSLHESPTPRQVATHKPKPQTAPAQHGVESLQGALAAAHPG